MRFQDTRWWKNYHQYDKIVESSSMRSTIDGLIYWKLLKHFKFKNFLEIGVYQGLTTGLFFESTNDAYVTAIDPQNRLDLFFKNYPEFQNQFKFMQQKSQDANFGENKYDFILIDGDHTYQSARHDIFKCLPYLTTNSVLAIDDFKMPGVANAINDLYTINSNWVPFLQAEQTQFWHHRSCNREKFIDSLFTDPLSKFIFVENIVDRQNNTICSTKTLSAFTDKINFFDLALTEYNI